MIANHVVIEHSLNEPAVVPCRLCHYLNRTTPLRARQARKYDIGIKSILTKHPRSLDGSSHSRSIVIAPGASLTPSNGSDALESMSPDITNKNRDHVDASAPEFFALRQSPWIALKHIAALTRNSLDSDPWPRQCLLYPIRFQTRCGEFQIPPTYGCHFRSTLPIPARQGPVAHWL